jgi:putative DNA primase/helicase
MVYPDQPTSWRLVDQASDLTARQRAYEVFGRFVSYGDASAPRVPSLGFNEPAQQFFNHWLGDLEHRVRNPADEHPVIVGHLAKYRSLMPSLALIFHLCDSTPDVSVSLEAAQRAAAWVDYLEQHARRIYHTVTARVDEAVRVLGQKIKARKISTPFTLRQIHRNQWSALTDRADILAALDALEELGWIKAEIVPATVTGGRPTTRYHVNPAVWQP